MLGYVTQIVDEHVIRACKGKWLVVINNWRGACEAADAGVNVIFRWHALSGKEIRTVLNDQNPDDVKLMERYAGMEAGDDDLCNKISAIDWVYLQVKLGRPDIWRYTCNESGLTSNVVKFHNDLTLIPSNLKYVAYNLSTGTPNPADLYLIENALRWAGDHPDRMKIGLHEYFYGTPYTACAGKHPMDWVLRKEWPKTRPDTCWHMGRFMRLVEFAKEKGFKSPEIVITETGHDFLGDLAQWMTVPVSSGALTARGFMSMELAWKAWKYTDDKIGIHDAYLSMLKHACTVMYANSPVVGACIFRYDEGYGWGDFATGAILPEASASVPVPVPVPSPTPVPEPVDPDVEFAKVLSAALGKLSEQIIGLQKLVNDRWK
jgi:hypothetical protein